MIIIFFHSSHSSFQQLFPRKNWAPLDRRQRVIDWWPWRAKCQLILPYHYCNLLQLIKVSFAIVRNSLQYKKCVPTFGSNWNMESNESTVSLMFFHSHLPFPHPSFNCIFLFWVYTSFNCNITKSKVLKSLEDKFFRVFSRPHANNLLTSLHFPCHYIWHSQ